MRNTLADAKTNNLAENLVDGVENAANKLKRVAKHIDSSAKGEAVLRAYSFASMFHEVTGDVTMAWMLLWRAMVAESKFKSAPRKKDIYFYKGQVKSAEFFIKSFIPITLGKMDSIMNLCGAAVKNLENSFGSK